VQGRLIPVATIRFLAVANRPRHRFGARGSRGVRDLCVGQTYPVNRFVPQATRNVTGIRSTLVLPRRNSASRRIAGSGSRDGESPPALSGTAVDDDVLHAPTRSAVLPRLLSVGPHAPGSPSFCACLARAQSPLC
jgi:hypothetical protein